MLLPLKGRSIAYDLIGSETAPVVCITHSLASDGGSWAEQVPALLQAGFRVLRIDMRGHGGSDPVPGDYTMNDLAGDVALVLDGLSIARVHYIGLSIGGMLGQAFALDHRDRLISILWCDTLPASPPGAADLWGPRVKAVREANSLAPIVDASMDRYLTPAFKTRNPGRWKQIEDTILGTTAQRLSGLRRGDHEFRFCAAIAVDPPAGAGGVRRTRHWNAGGRQPAHRQPRARRALRGDRRHAALPQCRGARRLQPHHAGLARSTEAAELVRPPSLASSLDASSERDGASLPAPLGLIHRLLSGLSSGWGRRAPLGVTQEGLVPGRPCRGGRFLFFFPLPQAAMEASSWLYPCDGCCLAGYPCASVSPLANSGFGFQSTSPKDVNEIRTINTA
jgi:3-oxoadipate enol-lactonase